MTPPKPVLGKSRVLVVTGASKGFGRELALQAREREYTVVALSRNPAALEAVFAGTNVQSMVIDITRAPEVVACIERIEQDIGPISVLVNNAGYGLFGPIETIAESELMEQLRVNVLAPFHFCQAVLPHMRARRSGHIVQISSIAGLAANAGGGAYHMSKFALEGMSESLAFEGARFGIRTLLVEPGAFRTDFAGDSVRFGSRKAQGLEELEALVKERIGALDKNQTGNPQEVARVILDAIEMEDPPMRLILGPDARARAKSKFEYLLSEMDEFKDTSHTIPLDEGRALPATPFIRPWAKKL